MCSIMITLTIQRTMSTELDVPAVPVLMGQPSPCSRLTVSLTVPLIERTDITSDSKQARDLLAILQESKQQIDPRLTEMARFGGGGGGRGYGRGGGRGGGFRGGRGGRDSGYTGSNSAPLGGNRRW